MPTPWEIRPLNGQSELRFCQDKPGEELEEIYFIFSNHNLKLDSKVIGKLEIRPLTTGCVCGKPESVTKGWQGTIRVDFNDQFTHGGSETTIRRSAVYNVTFDKKLSESGDLFVTWEGRITNGTGSVDDITILNKDPLRFLSSKGSGALKATNSLQIL